MTGPHKNGDLDEKTRAKMVTLFRDHGITVKDLVERFGRSAPIIKRVLVAGGAMVETRVEGTRQERAFAKLVESVVAGNRCPMNDAIPGGSRSLSVLARSGRIYVEVFHQNFRRVTILEGEHKGKMTAPPPMLGNIEPRPHLTIGKVKRRNGAIVPSLLDARGP